MLFRGVADVGIAYTVDAEDKEEAKLLIKEDAMDDYPEAVDIDVIDIVEVKA